MEDITPTLQYNSNSTNIKPNEWETGYVFITSHGIITNERILTNPMGVPLFQVLTPINFGQSWTGFVSKHDPYKYSNESFSNTINSKDLNTIFENHTCPAAAEAATRINMRYKEISPHAKPNYHINTYNNLHLTFNNRRVGHLFFIKIVNYNTQENINITDEIRSIFGNKITLNGLYLYLSGKQQRHIASTIPIIQNIRFIVNACRKTKSQLDAHKKKKRLQSLKKTQSNKTGVLRTTKSGQGRGAGKQGGSKRALKKKNRHRSRNTLKRRK